MPDFTFRKREIASEAELLEGKGFLHKFKKWVVENLGSPEDLKDLKSFEVCCPVCKAAPCYFFEMDLGGFCGWQISRWIVCPNPVCRWCGLFEKSPIDFDIIG